MKAFVIKYQGDFEIDNFQYITVIAKDKKEMNQKFNSNIENGQYKMLQVLYETEVIL
jgi:hypothetical protein